MNNSDVIYFLLDRFVLCGTLLASWAVAAGGVTDGGGLELRLTGREVQEAVGEAVVLVREQIEAVEPHVFHNGRVYGGQKINGYSLHYLNPPHEFLKLYKITK
ncbi:hypothetical protein E2C01_023271 [Portunus trituberculatus]|uniref:Uncharacterized protein n=1 Tax=Portunus trituberculatus TaxID=210409 RepID=A0A5B7E9J1_PORTR|nr:hypothetical protein [Portunus trituberculatus]